VNPASITFPESLPVSARRDEIARALQAHQVVVVCGETGSGKTTQLPKIALALGRGRDGKLIGHTQPRRIAASSVAQRIAAELNTPLGEVVGYKVRFTDRLQRGASVKLMTDGILLAESQGDPLLRAYDTIIIDEAHERSLNIDFLLGHLKQILPRRPELKVIVTSATIDADRFSKHFHDAPVIQVSGRLFPVEQRWRPFEWDEAPKTTSSSSAQGGAPPLGRPGGRQERDLHAAIADAADELWREGSGDILVFLSGEREIRECADHLRKHFAHDPRRRHAQILPLFARLSASEQDEVFKPHGAPRIVIATNVAETSLTVPGIRYVIDSGVARVKRYSYRNKVEQLQVEPISQAAANQRAGRCGRVADGICIRLYDESDFASRPRFTDPEILRSSLAGVILRMKSLGLGAVEEFPFLEPPPGKAIADGYALLNELGAVDEANELTAIGHELARLPLDPRIGRMILAAREQQSLAEVLVIAAAISGQDVRDRPLDKQQAADERHKPFDDEKSEFIGTLKLWRWIDEGRGDGTHHKLSNRQQEQRLRDAFISPRRVREWRDIHSQLLTVVAEHGWRINAAPATYEQIHSALLAGLLGNIGLKSDDEDWYLGARGIKFWRHPGANLAKKPGRWLVAAELVETTRLFGRGLAAIEPQWIERVGGHLLKKQLLEPHWEKKAGEVVALERATLYGVPVYAGRRVNFAKIDPVLSREIFIREALVEGQWDAKLPFMIHNAKLVREIETLEHKSRRQDVLVDDALIAAFYEQHVPAEATGGAAFERWYRAASKANPDLLKLTRDALMRHDAAGVTSDNFPRVVRLGGIDCAVEYLHQPGDARDGMTVTLPIYALNQASEERCGWLVPGMLQAKVIALAKSLPQKPRARLVPLPDFAAQFCAQQPFAQGGLIDALLGAVRERTQLAVQHADFKLETLSPHLFMNLRVVDEHGRQLGMGRNLAALRAELGAQARGAFQALAAVKVRTLDGAPEPARSATAAPKAPDVLFASTPLTAWTFGELPELMEVKKAGQSLVGFPALVDKAAHVEIEVFDEPDIAARRHRAGLRRLFALQLKEPLKYLEKNIPDLQRLAAQYMALGTLEELREQIIAVALDRAFLAPPLPTDAAAFAQRLEQGRARLNLIAQEVARAVAAVLQEHQIALRKLKDAKPSREVTDDATAQLQRLVGKRFIIDTPWSALNHLPRYLRALVMRLDKLRAEPARDAQRLAELKPLEQRWLRRVAERRGAADARLDEFGWLLEELRVSLFAQELRTPQPVSVKRLEKFWSQLSA
jgi:ATP-dependent helicase HrpA